MKKIIAILSVLFVAACVFAAVSDPTVAPTKDSIRVSTKIIPVEPTFVLKTDANDSESVTTSANADDHAGDGTAAGSIEYSKYVEDTTTQPTVTANPLVEDWISANFLLDNDATVTFGIYQRNVAISDHTYTLTATVGDLVFVTGSANKDGVQKFAVKSTTPAITADSSSINADVDKLALTASGNKLTAVYTGRVNYNNGTDRDIEIGTFDVVWQKNAKAEVGKYSADVTLTIVSD